MVSYSFIKSSYHTNETHLQDKEYMPTFENVNIAFYKTTLYDIVIDVNSYPEFYLV